jgi:hypothetical protein
MVPALVVLTMEPMFRLIVVLTMEPMSVLVVRLTMIFGSVLNVVGHGGRTFRR